MPAFPDVVGIETPGIPDGNPGIDVFFCFSEILNESDFKEGI